MEWTREQRRAIEARDTNLLLAAAAGSGKTAVLVERILSIIGEGHDVDRMLVVTFTRAAASDMRQKLMARLGEMASSDPKYRGQVERAEQASICTIHSLCADLIRMNFQAADVDPGFRVMDDAELGQLRAQAVARAMSAVYERGGDDLNALAAYRDHGRVAEMAQSLHEFAMARPDPWGWLQECLALAEGGDGRWAQVLAGAAGAMLSDARAVAQSALDLCLRPDGPDHYLDAARADIDWLDSLSSLEYEDLRTALAGVAYARLRSKKGASDDPAAARYKALRERMKKLVSKAQDKLFIPLGPAMDDVIASASALRALCAIAQAYDAQLGELKAERSALSYVDLEQRALRALRDEAVAGAARERYEFVFVDEYQDVSDIQEAILARVSRDNNLFMVGDVKQSIYRFRLAEPTLFIGKYARYGRGEGGEMIALNRNFRSRQSILDLTNAVFERAMRGGAAEIEYDEQARLRPGATYQGEDAPIELNLISGNADAEETGDEQPDEAVRLIAEMKSAEREGLVVIRRIRELMGTQVYDIKAGGFRALRPRDFVVLSRAASGVLPPMMELMLREGIPAYADTAVGFFDVMEVRVAVSLLSLIENRRLDMMWLSALRSPVVGLTSDELAAIRLCAPDAPYSDAVLACAAGEGELAEKLRSFMERLQSWRELARAMTLPRLIFEFLRETGYYAYVGGLPGGEQRQANLDALCARADAFDRAHAGGLAGFLGYIQSIRQVGSDMGAAHIMGEEDDVVRLMTVHKSKGLEFPVVFGVQLGRRFRGPSGEKELCLHRDMGIGLSLIDPQLGTVRDTLIRRAAAEKLNEENMAEEMRILYVLLTRAMDRVVLVGSVREQAAARDRFQLAGVSAIRPESYLDLIAPAILRMPGGGDLAPEGEASPADPSLPRVQLRWLTADALIPPAVDVGPRLSDEPEGEAGFARDFAWRYPHPEAALLPLKLTASGLSREIVGPDAPIDTAPRPAFMAQEGLTGAERGSAVHAAMQALKLEPIRGLNGGALIQEIERQLSDMARRGLLSEAARGEVDARPIARFWGGEWGVRALNAPELHREWTFNLRMTVKEAMGLPSDERMLVQGAIDLCFIEDGAWVLLDYKTDRADDPDAVLTRYRPQIALYARALERITGLSVRDRVICLLRAGRFLPVPA